MRVLLSALSFPAQPRFQELARREAELKAHAAWDAVSPCQRI